MEMLNTVAPVKEVSLKHSTEPWLSSDIVKVMKKRDFYLFRLKKKMETKLIINHIVA